MFKKNKRQTLPQRLARVQPTLQDNLQFDNRILIVAMREIIDAGERKMTNKAMLVRIAQDALREIGLQFALVKIKVVCYNQV